MVRVCYGGSVRCVRVVVAVAPMGLAVLAVAVPTVILAVSAVVVHVAVARMGKAVLVVAVPAVIVVAEAVTELTLRML